MKQFNRKRNRALARAARRKRLYQRKESMALQKAIQDHSQHFKDLGKTKESEVPELPPMRRRDILKWSYDVYNPAIIRAGRKVSPEEAQAEYHRLRKIVFERLKGLREAGYGDTKTYKFWSKALRKYGESPTPKEVAYGLTDFASYLMQLTSSAEGMEAKNKKIAQTLTRHAGGSREYTAEEARRLGEFFDIARTALSELEFGSDIVLEVVDYMEENKIADDEFLQIYREFKRRKQ